MAKLDRANSRTVKVTKTKKAKSNNKTSTSSKTRGKKTTGHSSYGYKKPRKKYSRKKPTGQKRRWFRRLIVLMVLISILYTLKSVFEYVEYQSSQDTYTMSGQDFIDKIDDIAIVEYRKSGILPSITVAQAILESNWGKSKLTQEANNLFGIKADSSWWGESVTFSTGEYYNSRIKAKFRKYRSWKQSIEDHTEFLIKNKRYKKAGIFHKKDYRSQAQALEDSGYATTQDKNGNYIYADKLIQLIERYRLYDLDKKVMVY